MFPHMHLPTRPDLREILSMDHPRLEHLFDAVLESFEADDRVEMNETRAHAAREERLMYLWAQGVSDEDWRTRVLEALRNMITTVHERKA